MSQSIIPESPKEFNASGVMQRLVDSILIRYTIATKDMSIEAIEFQATPESMSMLQLQKHILIPINWVSNALGVDKDQDQKRAETFEEFQSQIKTACQKLSMHIANLSDEELATKTIYLKRNDTNYPIWYIINGPLTDAIHHVGQIMTWRRIAGNPIPKLSPFTGESY